MIDTARSQRGGIANWQALDYQKRFVAYLAIKMLSDGHRIVPSHMRGIRRHQSRRRIENHILSGKIDILPDTIT